MNQRGQSTVESMMGFSAVVLAVVAAGLVWPDAVDGIVVSVAEWVARHVEIP